VIGIDTNVLIRYATQDDKVQSALAEDLVASLSAESPGFVSAIAIAESVWVLRGLWDADADGISRFVSHLLQAQDIIVEHSDAVRSALEQTNGSERFTDALLAQIGAKAGCEFTYTFDKRASSLPSMRLLERG
jgi:predicted nucleic-acid-binding protein